MGYKHPCYDNYYDSRARIRDNPVNFQVNNYYLIMTYMFFE